MHTPFPSTLTTGPSLDTEKSSNSCSGGAEASVTSDRMALFCCASAGRRVSVKRSSGRSK